MIKFGVFCRRGLLPGVLLSWGSFVGLPKPAVYLVGHSDAPPINAQTFVHVEWIPGSFAFVSHSVHVRYSPKFTHANSLFRIGFCRCFQQEKNWRVYKSIFLALPVYYDTLSDFGFETKLHMWNSDDPQNRRSDSSVIVPKWAIRKMTEWTNLIISLNLLFFFLLKFLIKKSRLFNWYVDQKKFELLFKLLMKFSCIMTTANMYIRMRLISVKVLPCFLVQSKSPTVWKIVISSKFWYMRTIGDV